MSLSCQLLCLNTLQLGTRLTLSDIKQKRQINNKLSTYRTHSVPVEHIYVHIT